MNRKLNIDLNCDMGESFGSWKIGDDKQIMPYVSSVNIACGFHAGDPTTMMHTIALALKHGVHIGAHPGYHDLEGFGRRVIPMEAKEIYNLMIYQLGAIIACAKVQGAKLNHVKPHGALYNLAAKNVQTAEAIVDAIYDVDPSLILYGLSGSELVLAANRKGLTAFNEVFADRTYQNDGTLTSRSKENAVFKDPQQGVEQVIHILKTGQVISVEGVSIPIVADTICIHGDHEGSLEFAKNINNALKEHQIAIR